MRAGQESDQRAGPETDVVAPDAVCVLGHAQPWFVPTVRAVAADLAARADFDLDAIADVRMAVDEACIALLRLSAPGQTLRCSFLVRPDRLQIDVQAPGRDSGVRVDTASFGWRVLQCLVDEVSAPAGGADLAIRLVKRQPLL